MSLIFYYAPYSSAVTCHWALEELGIPYEKVKIDLQAGDTKKPAFLALNPNGRVPTLVHDGVTVFESAAIIAYLGETFGVDKGLFPAAGPRRGEALAWTVWTNASLNEALSRYLYASSERVPAERRNAEAAKVAKEDVERHFGILDQHLGKRAYVLGEAFSLVDAHVAGWVAYAMICGFELARFPKLAAWTKTCSSRPGYAVAMAPPA